MKKYAMLRNEILRTYFASCSDKLFNLRRDQN